MYFYPDRDEFLSTSRSFSNGIGIKFQQNRDIIKSYINSLEFLLTFYQIRFPSFPAKYKPE